MKKLKGALTVKNQGVSENVVLICTDKDLGKVPTTVSGSCYANSG